MAAFSRTIVVPTRLLRLFKIARTVSTVPRAFVNTSAVSHPTAGQPKQTIPVNAPPSVENTIPWTKAIRPGVGTWHPVLLSPSKRFESINDANAWADRVLAVLEAPIGATGKCALENPLGGKENHLVMVQGTEFMFNVYNANANNIKADASHPVKWEYFVVTLEKIREAISAPKYSKSTIVVALASVVDYGSAVPQVLGGGAGVSVDKDAKPLSENAVFIVSNKKPGYQKVSKYKASIVDNPSKSHQDVNQDRVYSAVTSAGRIAETTYSITNFGMEGGNDLAIGFGICLDSKHHTFPGTSLVCLLSGDMRKDLVRYNDLGAFCLNDTIDWRDFKRIVPLPNVTYPKPAGTVVGERTWSEKPLIGEHRGVFNANKVLDALKKSEQVSIAAKIEEAKNTGKTLSTADTAPKFTDAAIKKLMAVSPTRNETCDLLAQTAQAIWPMTVKEGKHFYRAQDYTALSPDVVVGTPRNLPKARSLTQGTERSVLLSMFNMQQFLDDAEYNLIISEADKEAKAQNLPSVDADKIYQLVLDSVGRAEKAKTPTPPPGVFNYLKRMATILAQKPVLPPMFQAVADAIDNTSVANTPPEADLRLAAADALTEVE